MKTVLTYGTASEAEVDKSMLEAEGMVVYLLNRNSPWSAWGGPFTIQLQVDEQNFERATNLIRATSPGRFGNEARANEAGAAFLGGVRRLLSCVGCSIAALFTLEAVWNPNRVKVGDLAGLNLILGLALGAFVWLIYEAIRKLMKRS